MSHTQELKQWEHYIQISILFTKITAEQSEFALSYYRVRGLYFPEVIFAATLFVLQLHI